MNADLQAKVRANNLELAQRWFRTELMIESAAVGLCGLGFAYGWLERDTRILVAASFVAATSLFFAARTARSIRFTKAQLSSLRRNDSGEN